MTHFPRLYSDQPCPLDGYEGYSFRVLVNPTGAEKTDWALGHLGADGCADCARLTTEAGSSARVYCAACSERRAQLGRAAVAVYGTSRADGFDFSTADAALASFEQDGLPDELLAWLYMLPSALWSARADEVKKKLLTSLPTGSSTPAG